MLFKNKKKKAKKRKGYFESAANEVKQISNLTKDTVSSIGNIFSELKKVNWKKIPLKIYAYLAMLLIFMICIMVFIAPYALK